MARPKSSTPSLYWHKRARQWCLKLDGRSLYLGRDRGAAEAERKRLLADWWAKPPEAPPGPALTVAGLVGLFADGPCRRLDRRQQARYAEAAEALEPYEQMRASAFGTAHLLAVRRGLLVRPSRRGGGMLSRRYVNHIVGAIKAMWAWAASSGLVPGSVLADLRAVRSLREGEGGEETFAVGPPPPGWEAALAHLPPVARDLARVQALTGMRPGEACIMRECDISFSPDAPVEVPGQRWGVAAVEAGGVLCWVYVPATHKNLRRGKPRAVVLGPRAQEVLGPYLSRTYRAPIAFLFPPEGRDGRAVGRGLGHYTTQSYGRAVARACARAGCEPWSPGQLRHLAATAAGELAGDPGTAQAVLGHASPEMSAHYARQALQRAAAYLAEHG